MKGVEQEFDVVGDGRIGDPGEAAKLELAEAGFVAEQAQIRDRGAAECGGRVSVLEAKLEGNRVVPAKMTLHPPTVLFSGDEAFEDAVRIRGHASANLARRSRITAARS